MVNYKVFSRFLEDAGFSYPLPLLFILYLFSIYSHTFFILFSIPFAPFPCAFDSSFVLSVTTNYLHPSLFFVPLPFSFSSSSSICDCQKKKIWVVRKQYYFRLELDSQYSFYFFLIALFLLIISRYKIAINGQEAVDSFTKEHFDLILIRPYFS